MRRVRPPGRAPRGRAASTPRPGTGAGPRRRRPDPDERAIEARIAAGEDPDSFLCLDCFCWMVEPAYCLCRESAPW